MAILAVFGAVVAGLAVAGPVGAVLGMLASRWLGRAGVFADRRQVAFTVAMIALSAKMAKADGVVTTDEVAAFERLFQVPPGEERNVKRLFNLAKVDVAGYETYARRMQSAYSEDPAFLEDVVDGLFVIAKADGAVHEAELAYLEAVAALMKVDAQAFARIRARHVRVAGPDPYEVFGIAPDASEAELKARHRALVRENHPDSLLARGVPPACVKMATERLAAINAAWETIRRERGIA